MLRDTWRMVRRPETGGRRRQHGSAGVRGWGAGAIVVALGVLHGAFGVSLSAEPSAGSGAIVPEPTPVRVFRELSKKTAPGLPQSTIITMLQDRTGVLWLATLDGLGTFDGVEVKPVGPQQHAPVFGTLNSLAERQAGGVYAGASGVIHAFDGETWSLIAAPGISVSLVEDGAGELLRLDGTGELLRSVAGGSWQPVPLTGLDPAEAEGLGALVSLQRGPAGELWLAGRGGAAVRRDGAWTRVAGGVPVPAEITAFLPAAGGSCFIGTSAGSLWLVEPGAAGWTEIEIPGWRGDWIRSLEQDRRGRIWAGGNAGGVAFGRPGQSWSTWGVENGLVRGGIVDILADREGSMWFSVNGRGVQQWIGEEWSHRNLWQGDVLDPRLQVFGLRATADGRGFVAGVFGRGVWHWDGESMRQIEQEGFQDARIVHEIEPGVLWIGGRFGAWERRPDGSLRQLFGIDSGFVWDFEQGPGGEWLAATSSAGLFRLRDGAWSLAGELNSQLPNLNVRDILWHGDQLWAGTMGGLAVFVDGRAAHLEADSRSAAVNGLAVIEGEVWAAGFGGLSRWRQLEDGSFAEVGRLTEAEGMPGHTIYTVAQDAAGGVWVGGSAGVGRRVGGEWQVLTSAHGLIEDECNHQALWPAPGGSVYVGTMASLARWDGHLEPLTPPPLQVFWIKRPPASIPADQRTVRLDWRAPWLGPRHIEYRVRVPRLDAEWSAPQRERFRQLENLGSGSWSVEVAARFAGEQEWTPALATEFFIAPRFWETRSFAALCVVLIGVLVMGLVRWRTRALNRRAVELERTVREGRAEIKVLSGLLPICSVCKKVRDDDGYWEQIERYIDRHSEAMFSHSLCPSCLEETYPEWQERVRARMAGQGEQDPS